MLALLQILEVDMEEAHQYPLVPGNCSFASKLTLGTSQLNFMAKRTAPSVLITRASENLQEAYK